MGNKVTVQPAELLQTKVAVQSGLCIHCTGRRKTQSLQASGTSRSGFCICSVCGLLSPVLRDWEQREQDREDIV